MRRIIIACLLAVLLIPVSSAQSETPNDLIPEVMREINLWRLSRGLEVLVYNPTLERLAAYQADYLMTLPNIPNDIHAGPQGESPRERAAYDEFAWPPYGDARRIALTEIAAIGSVESAMGFWTTSDLHTRSALNPTYREVGVAARQRGTDVLFIVVLGDQPDVLPALADPESEVIYLTNERNEWTGDWIGAVERVRLLNPDESVLVEWQEWQNQIALPETDDEFVYVQYEDGDRNRVQSRVDLVPRWYSEQEVRTIVSIEEESTEEASDASTAEATAAPLSAFVTSTPVPTATTPATPTATPTPIPSPTPLPVREILVIYDEQNLTLVNSSDVPVDVYNLVLRSDQDEFEAYHWEDPVPDLNIGALPSGHCLQLGSFTVGNQLRTLPECRFIRSFVTVPDAEAFWREGGFGIFEESRLLATCAADSERCTFDINAGR